MEWLEQVIQENPELFQRVKLIYHTPSPVKHGKGYNEFLVSLKKHMHKQGIRQQNGKFLEC